MNNQLTKELVSLLGEVVDLNQVIKTDDVTCEITVACNQSVDKPLLSLICELSKLNASVLLKHTVTPEDVVVHQLTALFNATDETRHMYYKVVWLVKHLQGRFNELGESRKATLKQALKGQVVSLESKDLESSLSFYIKDDTAVVTALDNLGIYNYLRGCNIYGNFLLTLEFSQEQMTVGWKDMVIEYLDIK